MSELVKPIVYIETTVWSFPFATDSPEYSAHTRLFFERCRARAIDARISATVIKEVVRSDPARRAAISELIAEIAPAQIDDTAEIERLARAFVEFGAAPPSKPDDAAHVAAAFGGRCDVLVSWNFKHIANVRRADRFNAIALTHGFTKRLTIVTPLEML